MKKLTPGYNEEGWKTAVQCIGDRKKVGCGAMLEIERSDIRLRDLRHFDKIEASFTCECGASTAFPHGEIFAGGAAVRKKNQSAETLPTFRET
jgi:hypothetical protein